MPGRIVDIHIGVRGFGKRFYVIDDTKKEKITTCTDDRVDLELDGGSYCSWCYKKQQKDLSASKKRSTTCAQCKVPICESCWGSRYDHSISRWK